jgi:branched-subunit amino acid transport protein
MNAWIVVLVVGLGSYMFRLSMIAAADRTRLPAQLDGAADLVAPAAFTALAVTGIAAAALGAGTTAGVAAGGWAQAVPPLVSVGVAVLAVQRTGSAYAALLAGMPTLWLLTALLSA